MGKVFWGVLGALFTFFVLLPIGFNVFVTAATRDLGSDLSSTFASASKNIDTEALAQRDQCSATTKPNSPALKQCLDQINRNDVAMAHNAKVAAQNAKIDEQNNRD